MITLKGRKFKLARLNPKKLSGMVRQDPKALKQSFYDVEVYSCSEPGKALKFPKEITLEPLVLFWGYTQAGKPNPKGALRQARLLQRYMGAKSLKALNKLLVDALGTATAKPPVDILKTMINKDKRQVFGYWRVYNFFRLTAVNKGVKADFIIGLPVALEWGAYTVGMCGSFVDTERVKTAEGMVTRKIFPPKFVAGPYQKLKKAEYEAMTLMLFSNMFELLGQPTKAKKKIWKDMIMLLPKDWAKTATLSELGPLPPQIQEGFAQSNNRPEAKEGQRVLAKYG
ncbi:MAG: hypothetical protein AAF841_06150 [Pseudomonadota bacterium]